MIRFDLKNVLPFSTQIFDILNKNGFSNSVIFGGSIRDFVTTNYQTHSINDYDIRIVSNLNELDIAHSLVPYFGDFTIVPSLGNNKNRFIFYFNNIELDISIRPSDIDNYSLDLNTTERVYNSDAALSSFVLNSQLDCYCREEAISDINLSTLTFYSSDNDERLHYYVNKMQIKFPNRKIIIID